MSSAAAASGRGWARRMRIAGGSSAPVTAWIIFAAALVLMAVPLRELLAAATSPSDEWNRLASRLWEKAGRDTLTVSAVAMVLAALFGIGTAWLTAACEFPGRRFFVWALVLPLALPGYIAAYGWYFVLEKTSGVLRWMQQVFSAETMRDAEGLLRGIILGGIFGAVLFPYVFLTVRAAFRRQGASLIEASRLLGRSALETFRRIALPLARPALAGGMALVVMEVLNDYGAAAFFDLQTASRAVFSWGITRDDRPAAARLSLIVLAVILLVLWAEHGARGRRRFAENAPVRPLTPWHLSGWKAWAATAACALPLTAGFVLPGARIVWLAWHGRSEALSPAFLSAVRNSILLGAAGATLVTAAALLLAWGARCHRGRTGRIVSRVATMGYAMPGMIVALVMTGGLAAFSRSLGMPLLTGGLLALMWAYAVRFMAVPYQPVESGFQRVCATLDEASRSLGIGAWRTFWRIHLPLLRAPLTAGLILCFIDILKELPVTLVLRPENFHTLATRLWELNDQALLPEACVPALLITVLGTGGAIFLQRVVEPRN